MINSLVLQTYSPIIIPLSFIYGINFVEKELVYGGFPIIGFFALMISLLIYYDRVEDKKKDYLASGLAAFFISYMLLSYTKRVVLSAVCLMVSLFLIGYGISDMGFYSYKNQYIYLALFMIFVSLVFLIPYEREYLNAYSISMLMLAFAITLLVFMSVKTPLTA